ncbi:copper homeostasis protein CutC [Cohaesibacter marisflavi]|uniref:copper homeostasis protein CutC n=1 Tax=Cohaesibacter marisflavi TaxID=655353 RepID=UPI0029C73091|nr:copper homeostasis protein CutC [Cohaesibacter marisflavi]
MTSSKHDGKGSTLLEICVDNRDGLQTAISSGADRIELCSSLATGGLTPSIGFMALAAKTSPLPVHALIRPRSGDFCFNAQDIAIMAHDIVAARSAGLAGVVIGASKEDGRLDLGTLETLIKAAGPLDITLHRAFDMVSDFTEALDQAASLGIKRILTSGGAASAPEAIDHLQELIRQGGDTITIMPGGGINADTVQPFIKMGAREIHASCSSPQGPTGKVADLGFSLPSERQTDPDKIRALKTGLLAV